MIKSSILNQAQAIQIASNFCPSVGIPVSSVPTAQYPVLQEDDDDMPAPRWQARWQVTYPEQTTVEVVDATGFNSHGELDPNDWLTLPFGQKQWEYQR